MISEYREPIGKFFPLLIPEISDRIFYQVVPEGIDKYPAMAYLIDDESQQMDLKGNVYAASATVRLGIVGSEVDSLDTIKERVLLLCGVRKVPGFQLIELLDCGDADAALDISPELTGIEINLRIHL